MSAYIFGIRDEEVLKRAEILGVAMQLTNILRDIEEDRDMGRIYLPKECLDNFGVSIENIRDGNLTRNLQALLKDLELMARYYYREGNRGIWAIPSKPVRGSIRAASAMYEGILDKIRDNNYNPFLGRVYLRKQEKLLYILWSCFRR
jgi:15-cis-phytoene synthase